MPAAEASAVAARAGALPELAGVYWRPRMTAERLHRRGRLWTLTTIAHVVPFVVVAVVMVLLSPLALPVSLAALAHAWLIPELYARRGATVTRSLHPAEAGPERISLGLLGDLVDHRARELHARSGLVPEPGRLGTWLVGEAGALLVSGRRVSCWCVRATDPEGARLPSGDRVAHLLLALRSDEEGFATVANLAFSGARWRVRRRLPRRQCVALDAVCQRATLLDMSYSQGAEKPEKPSLLKRALALVILAVVLVLVAKILIGFVMAIFWILVAVVAVVAVLWALAQLL